jgi:polysaccharide export outer membrane protein
LSGLTRDQARALVLSKLSELYSDPEITLTVRVYNNNKAYVLGRVAQPGVVRFTGPGTLIEAISQAGGIPATPGVEPLMTECSIIRGKGQIIWIDLQELLNEGNVSLNARIRTNDLIYVPPAKQVMVYVMGEVRSPRPIPLRKEMTLMDALMLAGGPHEDAKLNKAYIIRWDDSISVVQPVDLKRLLEKGDMSQNILMEPNDILFLPERGIATFNYYLRQISPTLRIINLADNTFDLSDDNN